MDTTTTPHPASPATALAALGCVLFTTLIGACGGDPDGRMPTSRESAAAMAVPATTLVQGCVVDARHALRPGRSVRVLDPTGAVLGDAVSDAQGEFELRVPGGQWLTVLVVPEGRDLLQARADSERLWLSSCLQDSGP